MRRVSPCECGEEEEEEERFKGCWHAKQMQGDLTSQRERVGACRGGKEEMSCHRM